MTPYEKLSLIVTSAGVATAVGVLVVYALQLREMRKVTQASQKSAAAANDAARTAKDTLQMAYRPWVNAEAAELVQPLQFPPNKRFYLLVDVRLKNTGTAVASDGLIMSSAEPDYTPTLSKTYRRACDSAREMKAVKEKNTPWETGFVLAPGNNLTVPVGMGSDDITSEQVTRGQFYVVGCVLYRDQFGMNHHTQFSFQPTGPVTDPAAIKFRIAPWYHEAD